MTKIKSEYLQKELEVNASQSVSGQGISKLIISHDSLEKILYGDNDMIKLCAMAEYTVPLADTSHSVVLCTIKDSTGRVVQSMGESLAATLTTDMAREYPTLIASQRAFDRAMIRFLGIPGKVYSNVEVNEWVIDGTLNGQFVDGPINLPSSSSKPKEDKAKATKSPHKEDSKQPTAPTAVDEDIKKAGETVITMGGKNKTVAQLYEEEYSWLSFVVEKCKPQKPGLIEQQKQAKLYFEYFDSLRNTTTQKEGA